MLNNIFFDKRLKMYIYYNLKKNASDVSIKRLLHLFFGVFFKKYKVKYSDKKNLFFISVDRTDHVEHFNKIINACESESKEKISIKKIYTVNIGNIFNFFLQLKYIKKIDSFNYFNDEENKKINLIFKMIFYMNYIDYLGLQKCYSKMNWSIIENIIVYSDVLPLEQLLIKEANRHEKNTITCQHGIYPVDVSINTIDVLNYWNSPSKYALIWGEATKNQFNKYSEHTQCVKCGNLNIIEMNDSYKKGIIGIATDIPAYREYNQEMIDIAESIASSMNYNILIRMHPTDHESNYRIDGHITRFEKNIENSEFIIAHTTTMLFTYLVQGRKVFKFQSSIPSYSLDSKICFDSKEQLSDCIKNINAIDFIGIGKQFICDIDQTAKKNYTNFFDSLNKMRV